ncbi:16394_t:CDS:2, partial [Funneliformis geosporum]
GDEKSDLDSEDLGNENQLHPNWMILCRYPDLDLSATSDFIKKAHNIGLDDNERLDTSAFNICSITIYSALLIPVSKNDDLELT